MDMDWRVHNSVKEEKVEEMNSMRINEQYENI